MGLSDRRTRWATGSIAVLALSLVLGGGAGAVAQAAPSSDVTLSGHGFGHGRGLSQWGAYGYATRAGWSHQQILGHYYGGTTPSDIGNPPVTVLLTWLDGVAPAVTSAQPFVVDGRQLPAGSAARIGRNADGSWQLTTLAGCTGATTGSARITTPTFTTAGIPATYGELLTLCGPQPRGYRGSLTVVWDGALHTVNRLPMDEYLWGVVPREVPASWGDAAAGAGMNALRAQAVAARSYAQSENRQTYAKTCDTTACQVYNGAALNGASVEDPRTSRAVLETSGDVLTLRGAVARTEFHSSSGGWTAGGDFPAVVDDGDVASPYHDWTVAVPRTTLSAAFGVGEVTAVTVLTRNGLGADGGRVLTVRLVGESGSAVVSGPAFRAALGLRSDWFTVHPVFDPLRDDISPVGISAVRTSAGALVFVRGTDGAPWVSTARDGVFSDFQRIPGRILTGPAAVTANGSRIDLFVVGGDRSLWHTVTTIDSAGRPTGFAPWQSLGGVLTSSLAAASSTSGRLIVSGRGADGGVWSRTWDRGGWQPWQSAGGLAGSAPAVHVVDANTYRMLAVGVDGDVWSRLVTASTGAPTAGWAPLAEATTVAPGSSAAAWWARDIGAVGYATGAGVRQHWADGRVVRIGGAVTSGLSLVEFGPSTTWTFARGTDDALWVNVFSGTSGAWYRIGGVLA